MSNESSSIIPNGERQREGAVHQLRQSEPPPRPATTTQGMPQDALRSMIEAAPINVIYVDLNGIILYMNRRSLETLRTLQEYLPVRVDEIVGRSFDIFHENPSRQRRLIGNPHLLPHEALIALGPEKLNLVASAVFDERGVQIGAMATWNGAIGCGHKMPRASLFCSIAAATMRDTPMP